MPRAGAWRHGVRPARPAQMPLWPPEGPSGRRCGPRWPPGPDAYILAPYTSSDNACYVKQAADLQLCAGWPAPIRAARGGGRMHKPDSGPRPQHLVGLQPAWDAAPALQSEYPGMPYPLQDPSGKGLLLPFQMQDFLLLSSLRPSAARRRSRSVWADRGFGGASRRPGQARRGSSLSLAQQAASGLGLLECHGFAGTEGWPEAGRPI